MAKKGPMQPRAGQPRKKASEAKPTVPARIFAQVSPRSIGGVSLFDAQDQINAQTVANFTSDGEIINRTVSRLQDAGFEVLQISPITITIAGSAETYQRAFKTTIVAEERPVSKAMRRKDTATFLESPDSPLPGLISTVGTNMADLIEGVAIEEPRYYDAPSMFAPLKAYWHLRLPGDLSLAANADRAHRSGITGLGIRVAMVDSGWYKHPYFVGRGYRASPVLLAPASVNPGADEVGHGTGESANIFAIAPDVELLPVKLNATLTNSTAGFNAAVGLSPHIITCSWGSSKPYGPLSAADMALAAAISAAVAAGIVVVFSAGNGSAGFPGQMPEVISAGGVHMRADGTLEASNYASAFMSTIYAGRRVPDLCGLVGMLPHASYLMLPLEAGDSIDSSYGGGTFPNGDETATNDGWAAFSGTSAAAPQLAGASALILQACPSLNPAKVKSILMSTGRDVTIGSASPSGPFPAQAAGPGPDGATGDGLLDAHKAVLVAKVSCLGPIAPTTITTMRTPVPSVTPRTPVTSISPGRIPSIRTPITSIRPEPITAISPPQPGPRERGPVMPQGETPAAGQAESPRLSAGDVESITELIRRDEIQFDG